MRCLNEDSLHQEDIEVHLLLSHPDKVRILLVELRVIATRPPLSFLRFSTRTRELLTLARQVFLILELWTRSSRSSSLLVSLAKSISFLGSVLSLCRSSLSLRAMRDLRLRFSHPFGARSSLSTLSILIVSKEASAILLLLSSVVKPPSSDLLIARCHLRSRVAASASP